MIDLENEDLTQFLGMTIEELETWCQLKGIKYRIASVDGINQKSKMFWIFEDHLDIHLQNNKVQSVSIR
jgi:hypothetical protein